MRPEGTQRFDHDLQRAFDLAYTLVDVDSPVPVAVVRAIAAMDGVLSLRLLPERVELG